MDTLVNLIWIFFVVIPGILFLLWFIGLFLKSDKEKAMRYLADKYDEEKKNRK